MPFFQNIFFILEKTEEICNKPVNSKEFDPIQSQATQPEEVKEIKEEGNNPHLIRNSTHSLRSEFLH